MKLLVVVMMTCLLSACNTVSGAGKDISSSSEWVKGKLSGGGKSSTQKPASGSATPAAQPEPVSPAPSTAPSSSQTSI